MDRGSTPLHLAARCGNIELVMIYLNYNLSVDVVDYHNWTPLHESAKQSHSRVMRYLIKNSASCSILNDEGETALQVALKSGLQSEDLLCYFRTIKNLRLDSNECEETPEERLLHESLDKLMDQVKMFMTPSKKGKLKPMKVEKGKKSRFVIEKISPTQRPVISNPTTPVITSKAYGQSTVPIEETAMIFNNIQTIGRYPLSRSTTRPEMTLLQLSNLMSSSSVKSNQTLPVFKTSLNDKSSKIQSVIGLFDGSKAPAVDCAKKRPSYVGRMRTSSFCGVPDKKPLNAE